VVARADDLVNGAPTSLAAPARAAAILPRWAPLCYLLSPPFLTALLFPSIFERSLSHAVCNIAAVWVHTVTIGVLVQGAFAWIVPPLAGASDSHGRRTSVYALATLACVVVGRESAEALLHTVGLPHDHLDRVHGLYTPLLIAAGFVITLVTYERLRRHARDVEQREQRARHAALQAEVRSLQARTNPHFLFNALNTVAGLIAENPRRAEDAVERIADLFRYTLDASRRHRVTLREEIEALRAYLEMESLRFEDRLEWDIDVDDAALAALVPPLAVQPLVENAVRHGVEGRGRGKVSVRARRVGNAVHVSIADDGPGPGGSTQAGTRTSLSELRERLRLLYGEHAILEVRKRPAGGCVAELELPVA
jgi:two-component system, LytTR family, sensor histidine kinase AlgZ